DPKRLDDPVLYFSRSLALTLSLLASSFPLSDSISQTIEFDQQILYCHLDKKTLIGSQID
ncbi:MAG: hypothetical protein ONB13_02565, partial [candidate division KSB1 bacterium]|nr:hypothetical protein [candidate division KSB1 bacterium]